MNGEISIIHSFSEGKISDATLHMYVLCTVLLVLGTQVAFMRRAGRIGGKYLCVLLNSRIEPDSRNSRK